MRRLLSACQEGGSQQNLVPMEPGSLNSSVNKFSCLIHQLYGILLWHPGEDKCISFQETRLSESPEIRESKKELCCREGEKVS